MDATGIDQKVRTGLMKQTGGHQAVEEPQRAVVEHPHRIIGFDLLRGVAALLVLVYHVDFAFGLRGSLFVGGYLAVDLFFMLSGFVLAFNYQDSVRNGAIGLRSFIVARLARLYPLFLVTTLVGVPVTIARIVARDGILDPVAAVISVVVNLAILPSYMPLAGSVQGAVFPFNAASWSIFFEIVASLAFVLVLAHLSARALSVLALASLLMLAAAIAHFGTADVGYGADNFWAGLPRVAFSFCIGLLLHRLWQHRPWKVPGASLVILLAVFLALVQLRLHVPAALKEWADLGLIAIVIPVLVAVGAGATLRGPMAKLAVSSATFRTRST